MLDEFNIRQKQAYAAFCLWNDCSHVGIRHASIVELVMHLAGLLCANNIPDWEQRGSILAVTGRGDLLPKGLLEILPSQEEEPLYRLLEFSVEVGVSDSYGAVTPHPDKFLKKCIEILKRACVELPCPGPLEEFGRGNDMWGEPISENELATILSIYGVR